jgi:hypothetical protein
VNIRPNQTLERSTVESFWKRVKSLRKLAATSGGSAAFSLDPVSAADSKFAFRLLGVLAILTAVLCVISFFVNSRASHSWAHDIFCVIFGIFFATVGVGLLLLRKLAAVLLSVALAVLSLWMIFANILHVPFFYMLINICFAILMLLPAWITVSGWGALTKWI